MAELVARIQNNYCTKLAYYQCARFQVYQSLGANVVPPLMLPSQNDWARQILEEISLNLETEGQPAKAR